jgi:hypothetical protein
MTVLSKMVNLKDELCCNWKKYYKEMPDLMKYKQYELKYVCKNNNLHIAGNKSILVERIRTKYKAEKAICLIQSIVRRKTVQSYILLHGPAYKDKKCTNDTDFYTLEPFNNIHIKDFFSYKDECGFIFGFDFNSIKSLMKRSKNILNPYNRIEIPKDIIRNIKRLRALNRVYYPKKTDNAIVNTSNKRSRLLTKLEQIRNNKTFNERVSNLFYEIDQVENYSSPEWMTDLGRENLLTFIRHIYIFWSSNGRILIETKHNICPYFNPFSYQGVLSGISDTTTLECVQNAAITVCENMFHTAIDVEYKKMSAMYILMSITVVSDNARQSLPWLYESSI